MFVGYSCKQRYMCASYHQKRTPVTAINIAESRAKRDGPLEFLAEITQSQTLSLSKGTSPTPACR